MKTLKKTLCLILAVVMAVGVLVLPAYAADYKTAVTALENYGILHGYDDGKVHEEGSITRAEMAAIVYRVMTGDISGDNKAAATKYGSAAAKFTDAGTADWAKGYIGFCANEGVLKGTPGGKVFPNEPITGYEVQAMLLRALGYDKNNEYTGPDWTKYVLADATKAGISKNVPEDPAKVATRGAVAQLTYDAAFVDSRVALTLVPNVDYAPTGEHLIDVKGTPKLNDWGEPSTVYTCTFNWPDILTQKTPEVKDKALVEYDAPVTECDVAKAVGIKKSAELTTYTNGKGNAGVQRIDALDTTTNIGAQGRHIAVYDSNHDGDADIIVYKDTVLAKVTGVTAATYDTNGHELAAASTTVTVYGNVNMQGIPNNATPISGAPGAGVTNADTNIVYKVSGTYTMGQMLTVNILTGTDTPGNQILGTTIPSATYRAQNAKEATAKSVTVAAIIYDGASTQNAVGFVGTDGVRYLYDVSYGYYNDAVAAATDVLSNTAIGKTYSVYVDSNNNVLGINPSLGETGVGVVTDFKAVSLGTAAAGAVNYVVDYTILTADNTSVTVRAANSGVAYAGEAQAINAAQQIKGSLVSYAPNATTPEYYDVTSAATTSLAYGTLTNATDAFEIGDADAINTQHLVDNDTVFFVANYTMNNSLNAGVGAYVASGYSIYKGFQNLPYDYKMGNSPIFENGTQSVAANSAIGWQALTAKKDAAFAEGVHARYVLILNGTERTTNVAQTVPSYAYVSYNDQMYDTFNEYYQFNNVLVNGAKTNLRLSNTAGNVIKTNGSGLYTYADSTNGTYGTIAAVNKVATGNTWTYSAGVLGLTTAVDPNGLTTPPAGWNTQYYTVAADTQIYIVNNTTGQAYKFNGDLSSVLATYKNETTGTPEMYFQLNQYGWINFIYVVDNMTGITPKPVTTATINYTLYIVNPVTGAIVDTYTKGYTGVAAGQTFVPDLQVLAADMGVSTTHLTQYGAMYLGTDPLVGPITTAAAKTYNITIYAYYSVG